jgi:S1-C subfamily serine protease
MTTINAIKPMTIRPVVQAPAGFQPRFGNGEGDTASIRPTRQPQVSPKSGGNKLVQWILTAVLGLGVGGTAAHNYVLNNRLDQQHAQQNNHAALNDQRAAQDAAQIQGLRDRLAQMDQQSVSSQQNLSNLMNQVRELNGRTSLDQLVDVVARVTPSTVRVEGAQGLGSGVIIQDNRGRLFILTNNHVTEGNDINGTYHIKLYNGSDFNKPIEFDAAPVRLSQGQIAQSSPRQHDLALLAIPPDVVLPASVRPVVMRDMTATPLRVGEVAIAVGNPYGNRDSVSSGIISHVDRGFSLEPQNRFLQTDTPINPGNSGGGLFDLQGRLIGINTLGYRGADGLGGSIRIDVVKAVLESWGVPVRAPGENALDLKVIEDPANGPVGATENEHSTPTTDSQVNIPKSQTSKEAKKD